MAIQKTLLECVQDILVAMKSDEVSDIDETAEAAAVVSILEDSYNALISTIDFPDNWDFFQLELVDADYPTLLKLPDNIGKLEYVQYDLSDLGATKKEWRTIQPVVRSEFIGEGDTLDSADSNVYQFVFNDFDIRGYTDRDPTTYTTLDDEHVIFDNYQADYAVSLLESKTRCYGMLVPTFVRENDFVPEFEPRQFNLFFNEAKAQAFQELKEITNPKAEQRARRGWVQSQRKQPRVPGGEVQETWLPNYGRKGRR